MTDSQTLLGSYGESTTGGAGFRTRTPTDEFTGATKAAAITARNTYFTANAADLAEFDADPTLIIVLKIGTAEPYSYVYESRRTSAWADNTNVIQGAAGRDADATQSQAARAGAEAAQTAAEAAQTASESARTGAEAAQTASESARDASVVARGEAVVAGTAAMAARSDAQAAETNAETAETNAAGSATAASASASAAATSAANAAAQSGFSQSMQDALTDNTESGADLTFVNGKLNISVTGALVPDHTRYLAVSEDDTITDAEFSVTSTTNTLTAPTYVGNRIWAFAIPTTVADPPGVHIAGNSINQLNLFEKQSTERTLAGTAHKWWKGINPFSDLFSEETLELVY